MALGGTRDESLEISHRLERLPQAITHAGSPHQLIDGGEPELDRFRVSQGCSQPGAQLTRADRVACAIDQGHQGRQLEVADRRRVERHRGLGRVRPHGERARCDPGLVLLQVVQHHPRRADGHGGVRGADRSGKRDPEHVLEPLPAPHGVEAVLLDVGRSQQLRGSETLELRLEAVFRQLAQEQLAGRDLTGRQARLEPFRPRRDEIVRPRRLEVRLLDHGAWGQDAGHVAPDDLVLARRLHLVADHDLVAGAQELAHVRLPRVVRHAAHRRSTSLPERPGRQLHAHDRSGDLGVVEEDLVEVAEPEKKDSVGVLLFCLPVLPHDRCGRNCHAAGSPNSCPAVACTTLRLSSSPGLTSPERITIARLP